MPAEGLDCEWNDLDAAKPETTESKHIRREYAPPCFHRLACAFTGPADGNVGLPPGIRGHTRRRA